MSRVPPRWCYRIHAFIQSTGIGGVRRGVRTPPEYSCTRYFVLWSSYYVRSRGQSVFVHRTCFSADSTACYYAFDELAWRCLELQRFVRLPIISTCRGCGKHRSTCEPLQKSENRRYRHSTGTSCKVYEILLSVLRNRSRQTRVLSWATPP